MNIACFNFSSIIENKIVDPEISDDAPKDDLINFCIYAPKVFASLRSALGMSHQSYIRVILIFLTV